jgi:hypothetical protein
MHDHPLDLIAALADGSLSDEAEARALIESCQECRDEYRAQTEVIGWLAAAPAAEMTDLEKAALHRDLWTELRREPGKASTTPWWQRLSYVAAGLFVVAGLVGVLNNVEFAGGGEASDTTVAEASAEDGAVEDAPTEEVPFVAQGNDDSESATETTAATAETSAGGEDSLPLPFQELADEARAAQADRVATLGTDRDVEECLARLALDEHVVVDEIEPDQIYLLVMPEDPEAEPIVTFVALPVCEIVYVG